MQMIEDNNLENLNIKDEQKAPRVIMIFFLALLFMFSSVFKRIRFCFSIKDLSADEKYTRLDWFNPSGDIFDLTLTAVLLFIGCITSVILAIKLKSKITSQKEEIILFSPFLLLILHLMLQFICNRILYCLI